jgi:hypothetical protein
MTASAVRMKLIDVRENPAIKLLPTEIRKAEGYEWFDKKNKRDFMKSFEGLCYASMNKLGKQKEKYLAPCLDALNDDKACRALDKAKELNLKNVHLFAIMRRSKRSSLPRNMVEGQGSNNWRVIPIESFDKQIPVEHLGTLTKLRSTGIEFDDLKVAIPVTKPQRRPDPDPILLGRFGRFYVELGRWV